MHPRQTHVGLPWTQSKFRAPHSTNVMTWLLWSKDLGWVSHQSLEPLAIYSVIDSNIQFKNTADIVLNGNLVLGLTSVHQKREMWRERERESNGRRKATKGNSRKRYGMHALWIHVSWSYVPDPNGMGVYSDKEGNRCVQIMNKHSKSL